MIPVIRGIMTGNMRVLILEDGADAERVSVLAGYLHAELARLDLENVTAVEGGGSVPGTRAGDGVSAAAGLLVAFGQAADGLRSAITAIRNWLSRSQVPGRAVRLEIDGDVLELSQASDTDQERLIQLFVSRHAIGRGH